MTHRLRNSLRNSAGSRSQASKLLCLISRRYTALGIFRSLPASTGLACVVQQHRRCALASLLVAALPSPPKRPLLLPTQLLLQLLCLICQGKALFYARRGHDCCVQCCICNLGPPGNRFGHHPPRILHRGAGHVALLHLAASDCNVQRVSKGWEKG